MALRDDLAAHLNAFATLPYLFVGSGLSRRYLGLAGWDDLLNEMSRLTGHPYAYFRARSNNDLPRAATLIAEAVNEVWWDDPRFDENREAFENALIGSESALKIEIASHISRHGPVEAKDELHAKELELLQQSELQGLITTNWDRMLEQLFPAYKTYVGQQDLLFSNPTGIGEIFKIHGCCTQPNSLVLTEHDYQEFHARSPYLAAKLLAIFVEHPVLFLGYSLRDENVARMLESIASCLTSENVDKLQDRLIFVDWSPKAETPSLVRSSIKIKDKLLPTITVTAPDFVDVFSALASLPKRLPARLLRQLKEQISELVLSHDPQQRLHVVDIDDSTRAEDLEIVFGVGRRVQQAISQVGFGTLTRRDILNDIVDDSGRFDGNEEAIVQHTIPLLHRETTNVPVFKYLRRAGMLDEQGRLTVKDVHQRVVDAACRDIGDFRSDIFGPRQRVEILEADIGIAEVEDLFGPGAVVKHGTWLPKARLDPSELKAFLQRYPEYVDSPNTAMELQYRRLVCILDLLLYKRCPQPPGLSPGHEDVTGAPDT